MRSSNSVRSYPGSGLCHSFSCLLSITHQLCHVSILDFPCSLQDASCWTPCPNISFPPALVPNAPMGMDTAYSPHSVSAHLLYARPPAGSDWLERHEHIINWAELILAYVLEQGDWSESFSVLLSLIHHLFLLKCVLKINRMLDTVETWLGHSLMRTAYLQANNCYSVWQTAVKFIHENGWWS